MDKRRFQLYFDVHATSPSISTGEFDYESKAYKARWKVHGLKIGKYISLKTNDDFAYQYCRRMLLNNRNDEIDAVFRSLDDVEYLPVLPSDNAPSMENEILEISANLESILDINANDMDERDFQNYNSASNEDSDDLEASEKELPVSTSNNGNNDLETNKMELPIDTSNDVQHEVPATAAASEVNVSSLATSSSVVWKHATLAKNKETWSCNHCEKIFKYSKNTSNIIAHLRSIHPLLFQYKKKTAKTAKSTNNTKRPSMAVSTNRIENCFKRIESFKNGCENDKITNSILFMICKDMLPLNLTSKLGFQAFVKIVTPLYKIPSPKSIVQILENKYDFFKKKLVNDLENSINYCITLDCWRDISAQTYMGVTISYLTHNFEWITRALQLMPLEERHTGDYLKSCIKKSFDKFKIDMNKINLLITDGEQAIKNAATETVGIDKYLTCIAHKVSHIIPDALREMRLDSSNKLENSNQNDANGKKIKSKLDIILEKMHKIINKIRSSSPASDALRKAQMDKDPAMTPLQLILDIEIRWTTLPSMIKRYLDLEKFIYIAMSECNSPIDVLNREEQLIMSDVLLITEPIAKAIEYISGQSYPTCGLIIPIINGMEKCIQVLEPSSKDGITFKKKILDSINFRFKDFEFNSVLANATFLDPRYKKDSFRNPMAVIKAQNQINTELIKTSIAKKPVDEEVDLNSPPLKKSKVPDVWDLDDESRIVEKNRKKAHLDSNAIHPELNQFYQMKRLEREDDPIKFWRNQKEALPTIYPLAIKYAIRLATSVPSERMFSNAGLTKTKIRNRLDPEHLDMLVFLHSWELEDWFSI